MSLLTTLYIVFTIQSSFLTNTPYEGPLIDETKKQFFKCNASNAEKPVVSDSQKYVSADGKYVFPITNDFNNYGCDHHNYSAVDIFTTNDKTANHPQRNLPTLAYTSGTITRLVLDDSLGGIYIILHGDDGRWYYYAHHCAAFVTRGQRVEAGDVIGITNQTGLRAAITPEHLHFAIQSGGSTANFTNGGDICAQTEFEQLFTPLKGRCPVQQCGIPVGGQ